VSLRRTTICCCFALALTRVPDAATPPSAGVGLFPLRGTWELSLGSVLTTAPTLQDTRGFFPIDGERLVAYDLDLGTRLWIAHANPQFAPTVSDRLVFVSQPDSILALDLATGEQRWSVPIAEPLDGPLVWDNGWLMAVTRSGTLLAFRGSDGQLIWRHDLNAGLRGHPALAADRVYVALANGRVRALNVQNGAVVWERQIGGAPVDVVALEDRIYVGSDDNYLYCLETRRGEIDWRWMTGGDIIGRAAYDEARVYILSTDNLLRALDRRSGNLRWKQVLPLRPSGAPVLAGDVVLVSGVAPTALAFSAATGEPAGEIPSGSLPYAPPYPLSSQGRPAVITVLRDVEHGTLVKAFSRDFEPRVRDFDPLPGVIAPPALPRTDDETAPDSDPPPTATPSSATP
jgi:outer membrane protein assembly factor BamB